MSDNDAKIIRHKLTRLLSRREQSQFELRRKLSELEVSSDLIDETIAKFAEKDIQSDIRYAEAAVRVGYRNGKGPVFVERQLSEHNIDAALVKELIANESFDWFESAKAVRLKRFGENLPKEWLDKQKQMRFLQYRGFIHEQIKDAFE
jgi:regulatory protein